MDKLLAEIFPQHSRAALQALIKGGAARVDGELCLLPRRAVTGKQEVQVDFAALPAAPAQCEPEDIALDVTHEDDCLLVVNKPAGLVCHPGHGNNTGTLQAGILRHLPAAAALPRAGLAHRLDKETSGLLAIAKNEAALRHLQGQLKTRQMGREYLALARGSPPATGAINLPIGRSRHAPTKMAVRVGGREAITHFRRERQWRNFALLRCFLQTGRTHQIRVHLAHRGFPVVGDSLYERGRAGAPPPFALRRHALHAARLRLQHPQTNEEVEWSAPLPQDMARALAALDAAAGSAA